MGRLPLVSDYLAVRSSHLCSPVTIEDLKACEPAGARQQTNTRAVLKRKLEKLELSHVRALFATRKLAFSTGLIMTVWALIGLGYPLYNNFLPYLQSLRGVEFGDGSTYVTYRDALVVAAVGIPGALLGGYLVEVPRLGRKGTLCLATLFTGGFLYGSTSALTSGALLGWNCGFNFAGNIMYAVLYAYTPEIFPTKDRGTGNALTATSNRVFGIMAVSSFIPFCGSPLTNCSQSSLCLQISTLLFQSTRAARSSSSQAYW
jgi:MFS family permease